MNRALQQRRERPSPTDTRSQHGAYQVTTQKGGTGAGLVRADSVSIPLRDNSVDLIVTSPPYFALRSYTDNGEHYDGQIGSEPTPQDFLEALWAVTRECRRVLKPSGSLWVNLGDKYAGSAGWCNSEASAASSTLSDKGRQQRQARGVKPRAPQSDIRPKSLMGLPWRYAIGCIDDLDLTLRAEVVWSKPNGLPESVTDRVRRSHEQWFHFTREPRYFAAVDEVREPSAPPSSTALRGPTSGLKSNGDRGDLGMGNFMPSPLGKLPGSVWTIPSESLKVPDWLGVDHFAAFPQEWPRRLILGWSPPGICVECGEGRRPVAGTDWSKVPHELVQRRVLTDTQTVEWCDAFAAWCVDRGIRNADLDRATGCNGMGRHWTNRPNQPAVPTPEQWSTIVATFGPVPAELSEVVNSTQAVPVAHAHMGTGDKAVSGRHRNDFAKVMSSGEYRTITGYACACPDTSAPTRPAVVLDPFGGTGTVAMVARALGRYPVHLDLSRDYLRLARWRIYDSGHASKTVERTNREAQGVLL